MVHGFGETLVPARETRAWRGVAGAGTLRQELWDDVRVTGLWCGGQEHRLWM